MSLVLNVLAQTMDFQRPFTVDVPGFTTEWWNRHVGRAQDQRSEFLSFTLSGDEVARAEVYRGSIGNIYVGLTPAPQIIDVAFFEVRDSYRRTGIGRAATGLITQRHEGEMLIAFSEEADHFWSGIGWKHYPREDGSRHHRALFVFDGRLPTQPQVPVHVR